MSVLNKKMMQGFIWALSLFTALCFAQAPATDKPASPAAKETKGMPKEAKGDPEVAPPAKKWCRTPQLIYKPP